MATWEWDLDPSNDEAELKIVWQRLRFHRNRLLAACDFRMISDAPWDIQPWVAYRQALRDLPDATTDPRVTVWPIAP